MARCPGCGGSCTCQIVAADSSIDVAPTPNGVTVAAKLASGQSAGFGGANMLQKIGSGLYLGAEAVQATVGGGGGGGGSMTFVAGSAAGGLDTRAASTWHVRTDGFRGFPEDFNEPRISLQTDGSGLMVLPDQGLAVQGHGGATDLTGGSAQWLGNLPRNAQSPLVLQSTAGPQAVVPAAQSRMAVAVCTIEIGQRLPDPAAITFAAKTAAWYIDWGLTLRVGSSVVQLVNNVIRFEPQPMSRNVRHQTFMGPVQLPAGASVSSATFTVNNDQLPSSPAITVAVTGWSIAIIY